MIRKIIPCGLLLVLAGLLCSPLAGAAQERITDFQSSIVVRPDSSLEVTEKITVAALGREIKRGIVREFPTKYKTRSGDSVRVGFEIKRILKNGSPEPYHTKSRSNGVAVYIGDKDVFLKSGRYTYTIVYETNRQIGFFDDFDELYWNVTGNGWTFAIEKASARITLPQGAEIIRSAGYTGPQGAKGKDFMITPGRNNLSIVATRPLAPKEGLTVALAWPKGFVTQPSAFETAYQDYRSILFGLIGLAVVFVYYLFFWFRVGRDPERGTVIPLYEAPAGLSPAAVRYIAKMGYDKKTTAVALVDMAVKKYLTIRDDKGEYSLHRTGLIAAGLSAGEKKLARHFFAGTDKLVLKNKNHRRISKGIGELRLALKNEFGKSYFMTNRGYFGVGLLLSLAVMAVMVLTSPDLETGGFISLWLSIWTFGCVMLAMLVFGAWRRVLGQGAGGRGLGGALFITLFATPFFGGEIMGLFILGSVISLKGILIGAALAFLNVLFFRLLKAPTLAGRKILDRIEGLKRYLTVAEKDRLNLLNPPEETPALFEKFLPYAMALDVEVEWGERFAAVLARAAQDGQAYSPHWYTGRAWSPGRIGGFTSSLGGSFSGAVSSSSAAPGSSSGSGGGGSSGGGGGGGGGSGW